MIQKITFGNSNCYLIKQDENFMLIDTELPTKSAELISALEKAGVTRENFKIVVLTHGHVDHVGNALELRDHFGVKIAIGKSDAAMISTADITFPKAHKFFAKILRSILAKKNKSFTYKSFEADILLGENDSLEKLGFNCKIISLSGHTMGSIGVIMGDSLFTGDAAMIMKGKLSAPIFGESCELMNKALSKIMCFDTDNIYTGH